MRTGTGARCPGPMRNGGNPGCQLIRDLRAQRAQRIDQVADRPLAHARNAIDAVLAARERKRRDERAHRQSGQPEEEVGLLDRERAPRAGHRVAAVAQVAPVDAERAQRIEHHLRVVGFEQSRQRRRAVRERREQQRAIGDAFRAGKRNGAFRVLRGSERELRRDIGLPRLRLGLVAPPYLRRRASARRDIQQALKPCPQVIAALASTDHPLSSTTGCARRASHARRAMLAC